MSQPGGDIDYEISRNLPLLWDAVEDWHYDQGYLPPSRQVLEAIEEKCRLLGISFIEEVQHLLNAPDFHEERLPPPPGHRALKLADDKTALIHHEINPLIRQYNAFHDAERQVLEAVIRHCCTASSQPVGHLPGGSWKKHVAPSEIKQQWIDRRATTQDNDFFKSQRLTLAQTYCAYNSHDTENPYHHILAPDGAASNFINACKKAMHQIDLASSASPISR